MGCWMEGMGHGEVLMEPNPHHPRTCTDDTGILCVPTVVHGPAAMPAVQQGGLIPAALHVVQQDAACAGTKVSTARGGDGGPTAQLAAHHVRVPQAPKVVTHCAPALPVLHLHAALADMSAVGQPYTGACSVILHWGGRLCQQYFCYWGTCLCGGGHSYKSRRKYHPQEDGRCGGNAQ